MSQQAIPGETLPTEHFIAPPAVEAGHDVLISPAIDAGDFFDSEIAQDADQTFTVIDTKYSGGEKTRYPLRTHNLITTEIDGVKHVYWHTLPVNPNPHARVVFVKLGLAEIAEQGIGWHHHKQLSHTLPEAEIITHATHGVGPHGQELGFKDLIHHGTKQMAQDAEKLMRRVWNGREFVMVGISQGTVINHKIAHKNLTAEAPLAIAGIINVAPALVARNRIFRDMILRFMPSMVYDGASELFVRTRLCHLIGTIAILANSKPRARDFPTLGRQALDLIFGTLEEEIVEVIKAYPVANIVGKKDPVGQVAMHKRHNPDNLRLVRGGHGIALDPIDGADKVAKTAVEFGMYAPAQPSLTIVD